MSSAASVPSAGRFRLRGAGRRPWWPVWSKPAALRAVRATLVMPGLFALAFEVVGNLQMALFAGFGSFATLVLVTFAGTRRDKLRAHIGLALAGSGLLMIGTAVSSSTALAASVTVVVTFIVFFSGVLGPNAASGVTGALLAYVLPAASPGTIAMIPDRLAGWWMASAAGTAAVLLIATPPTADRLRAAVASVTDTLADQLEAMLRGDATTADLQRCMGAKQALPAQLSATPFRPTGLSERDQALAGAVELVQWCSTLVVDTAREHPDLRDLAPVQRELISASASVLRDSGRLFAGSPVRPDLEGLDTARRRNLAWLNGQRSDSTDYAERARISLHAYTIAMAVLAVGADALIAGRLADDEWIAQAKLRWFAGEPPAAAPTRATLRRYARAAARHASLRSTWFVNGARGAVALAAAVAVADLSSVQHGFWVVLGALSVLRTSAAATGATALRALAGTTLGFIVGGALLLAIGTSTTMLWVVLPLAVLVAAYAPGAAPFVVGQAAFTVTVAVLFNLLVPVGWKVGELRVEDVALGCAVSLVVGILFWPRGAATLVGDDLADAYRAGARYLREAVEWVSGVAPAPPAAGPAAVTAGLRLDDALRGFIAEQGTKHIAKEELWRLSTGTLRQRLTARAIAELPRECAYESPDGGRSLVDRAERLERWYDRLAALVGRPEERRVAELTAPTSDGPANDSPATSRHAIWLHDHLDHLTEHLGDLVLPAERLAEVRRRPWWR